MKLMQFGGLYIQLSNSWLNSFFGKQSLEYNSTIHLIAEVEKFAI